MIAPTNQRAAQRRPIPAISVERWQQAAESIRSAAVPVVIKGAFDAPASAWSPQAFSELWPTREVRVTVNLPDDGVPYQHRAESHERTLTFVEFKQLLDSGEACYLNQMPISEFPELSDQLDLSRFRLSRLFSVNLWIGGKTKSGLHFDNADNFFGQIFGRKRALMINPIDAKKLYPFADNPSKSSVNPDAPDLTHHPLFAECEIWEADLGPGDALFMPKAWWHYIAAEGVSISVNCWHGDTLSEYERTRLLFASGPRVAVRMMRDFVWHGMMHKPYQQRLFSPPPLGVELYRFVASRFERKGT